MLTACTKLVVMLLMLLSMSSLACAAAEKGHMTGSIAGRTDAPASKTWAVLAGLGSIAFAYEFSVVLVEIQVT